MSSSHIPAHHDAGHAHGGADHVPHVLPIIIYLKTYGALLGLTVLTVGASYLDLGHTLNLLIALGVATVKAVTVAALFMHLLYDDKFFAVIIGSSVIFLGIFLAFTMFDTNHRGLADPYEKEKPANYEQPFNGGTRDDKLFKEEAEAMKVKADENKKQADLEAVPSVAPTPAAPTPAAPTPAAPAPAAPAPAAPAPAPAPVAPPPAH